MLHACCRGDSALDVPSQTLHATKGGPGYTRWGFVDLFQPAMDRRCAITEIISLSSLSLSSSTMAVISYMWYQVHYGILYVDCVWTSRTLRSMTDSHVSCVHTPILLYTPPVEQRHCWVLRIGVWCADSPGTPAFFSSCRLSLSLSRSQHRTLQPRLSKAVADADWRLTTETSVNGRWEEGRGKKRGERNNGLWMACLLPMQYIAIVQYCTVLYSSYLCIQVSRYM
jgi:hypothetical protein